MLAGMRRRVDSRRSGVQEEIPGVGEERRRSHRLMVIGLGVEEECGR
jgi:hypothetical protein